MSELVLIKYGRYSCVIRPELRRRFQDELNKNKLVNDLLEQYYAKTAKKRNKQMNPWCNPVLPPDLTGKQRDE